MSKQIDYLVNRFFKKLAGGPLSLEEFKDLVEDPNVDVSEVKNRISLASNRRDLMSKTYFNIMINSKRSCDEQLELHKACGAPTFNNDKHYVFWALNCADNCSDRSYEGFAEYFDDFDSSSIPFKKYIARKIIDSEFSPSAKACALYHLVNKDLDKETDELIKDAFLENASKSNDPYIASLSKELGMGNKPDESSE